jgi:hypothetical protein
MRKYLCTLSLLPAFLIAISTSQVKAEYVIVGDDDLNAQTTDVTLKWSPNPEDNIAGYNVYYGRISGDYARIETVGESSATITVRGTKTVYFAVTAFNTDGLESDLSDEVHYP